ncbi:MAG: hypothetical protein WBG71_10420 [Leeuwenhoekiella sp.]
MINTFNFKSIQIYDNSKSKPLEDVSEIKSYLTGTSKTLDFAFQDGTRRNFPYSFYQNAELLEESGKKFIKVRFLGHSISIKGYGLEGLYDELIQANLSKVYENDERYYQQNEHRTFITEINISEISD